MKSILITGASTGIGEACAHYFAARGWRVYAGVRRQVDADKLAAADDNITPLILDVTESGQIAAAITRIEKETAETGLQGLVNNAGIGVTGPMEFLPMEQLRLQMEVNLFGAVAVAQAALSLLRKGQGRIANMSSIGGRVAAPLMAPYTMSKFALEAFSDALRRELQPWGLHVASIEPGAISTPIWQRSLERGEELLAKLPAQAHALYGTAMQRMMQRAARSDERGLPPEAVARVTYQALTARRPRPRYIVGRGTRQAIFLARWVPDRLIDWVLTRQLYR